MPDPGAPLAPQTLGAGVVKRSTRLADGRELIYFDDPGTTLGPERAVDARDLAPRPDTATMRRDVLTGDWVSIAAARQNRAFLPPAELDPLSPQTPTNPSEIPSRYDVAVFENKSPSFGPALTAAHGDAPAGIDAPRGLDDLDAPGLGRTRTSVGRCEVVCFSPEHSGSFGTLTRTRARTVIEAWADRTAALSALPGRRAGLPVREPRRGDRRHAPPSARADLRVPLHHAAHDEPARLDRPRGARPVRPDPRVRARVRARHPAGRALDRVRAVRRALAARGPPAPAPPRRRLRRHRATRSATSSPRSTCGCCAASTRCTTPRRPYIAAWHQAPVRRGRDTRAPAPAAHLAAPRGGQAQVPRRIRGRHGRLDRRHPARDLGRAPARSGRNRSRR